MIGRVEYWRTLDRWVPGGAPTGAVAYPEVPIGEVLRPRVMRVSKEEFEAYTPITIHFDGTVERRHRATPFKGPMYAAQSGDVVFSKIDVRNGALAMVPATLAPAVVTSEYPVHVADLRQIDPRYLSLILRSPNFLRLLRDKASGTSGRKRVTADVFSRIEIPLPDLQQQRALLNDFHAKLEETSTAENRAAEIERHAERVFEAALGLDPPPDLPHRPIQVGWFSQIEKWSHEGIQRRALKGNGTTSARFDLVPLEVVARVNYGLQKSPQNRPGRFARPYLRVANVQRGYLDLREIKHIDVPVSRLATYVLRKGDVLLCEGNSADLVGRGAIWNDEIPNCVHQNHVLRVRVRNKRRLLPEFVLGYVNSAPGQAYFKEKAKRTTNLASINSTEVKQMPIPLPPTLEEQDQLVVALQEAKREAARLRESAKKIRATASSTFFDSVFE